MLKQIFRLKWKDINFLIRKRKYFPTRYFWFFYYEQYPNLKFNQISINIPIKYSKKAVQRVALKRQLITYIQWNKLVDQKINNKFYKIFVNLNKKNISELKSQIEKFDKGASNQYILKEFKSSFFRFSKKIWI
jgi:RNase P protein component